MRLRVVTLHKDRQYRTVGHVDGRGRNYVGAKENVVNVLY